MKRLTYQNKKVEPTIRPTTTVAITVINYTPFEIIITITNPQFKICQIYENWLKGQNLEFDTKNHKINNKTLYQAYYITPKEHSFIDVLIKFAYDQTYNVFIIDKAYTKDEAALIQMPTTEKFIMIDKWVKTDPKSILTL